MIDLKWLNDEPLDPNQRAKLQRICNDFVKIDSSVAWRTIVDEFGSELPFSVYRRLWDDVFEASTSALPASQRAPRPMWIPHAESAEQTPLGQWMHQLEMATATEFHEWSTQHRADFWQGVIERLEISFDTEPTSILAPSSSAENPNWLPGARLNITNSCFLADPESAAIVAGADGTVERTVSYGELQQLTQSFASGLHHVGFAPGDAIAVYMPMTIEAVVAYLGILHAGCIAVSIADSFAPPEVANRLQIADAKGVVTYDTMTRAGKVIPMYERLRSADSTKAIVIAESPDQQVELAAGDIAWDAILNHPAADQPFEPFVASIDDSINILFSSGTTGDPKAIPWTHATPIKCAADAMLHQSIVPGDVVAWPTNLGWMMGPWLIFAALMRQATIALHEDSPGTREFGEFVQNSGVTMLGVVPTMVKAWRASACMEGLNWAKIRCFSSTGESSQAEDMFYLSWLAGFRPVIEYCGGTEIGGGYICSTLVQPNAPATFSTFAFGLDGVVLDDQGARSDEGELFLIPPSIGLSQRLLNRNHHDTYFAGTPEGPGGATLRRHGDHFRCLPGGYLAAGGRVDDTMNLGGIKISSAEIERVLNRMEGVKETAAVAIQEANAGIASLCIFTVLEDSNAGAELEIDELKQAMTRAIKTGLNPLFKIDDVRLVESLPRTASNKVMRRMLRDQLKP